MPVYQYGCVTCSNTLEIRQHFDEEPLRECPSCGGTVRRLFHPVGIVFKGNGWYCTDSRPRPSEAPSEAKSNTVEDKKVGAAA